MALEAFLKFEKEVPGESKRDSHEGELELSSYSFGLSNASDAHTGGGAAASIGNFSDLQFSMDLDKAGPNLFLAAAQGDHFDKVTLISRKVGGDALVDYVKAEMEEVFVSSFQMGASSGSEKAQVSGSLNFAKITFTYTPQKEDGTPDAEVVQGFDIKVGKKV